MPNPRLVLGLVVLLSALGCQCGSKVGRVYASIAAVPKSIDFGTVLPGAVVTKPLVLSNEGKLSLTISELRLEDDARGAFSFEPRITEVPAGEAVSLEVTYRGPATDGADGASLVVVSDADNAPELRISLAGRTFTECPGGQLACAGACVDVQSSNAHCGRCDNACTGQSTCEGGKCVCKPKSCVELGFSCGSADDGCGTPIGCGGCDHGASCVGNVCACPGGDTESACGDGQDNDCDGKSDCDDLDCTATGVCAQPTCEITTSETRLSNGTEASASPVVVSTPSGFSVAWQESPAMRFGFRVVDGQGNTIGGQGQKVLGASTTIAHMPRMVWSGQELALAYSDTRDGVTNSNDVYFARYTSLGAQVGTELAVATGPALQFPATLAWSGTEYGVLFSDNRDDPQVRALYFARVSSSGAKLGGDVRVTTAGGGTDFADIVWSGSQYGIAWTDIRDGSNHIYFNRLDGSGAPQGQDLLISTGALAGVWPRIGWSGTEFGVAYADRRGNDEEIYFQRVSATGAPLGGLVRVTNAAGASTNPALLWTGSAWLLAWQDGRTGIPRIFVARVEANGTKSGADRLASCSTSPAISPHLALGGGQVALAFGDKRTGNFEVFLKVFAP